MAAASNPPPARKKGLDLGNPGGKEYIIVGGTALGLALLYFWWKNRQSGTAAAASPSSSGTTTASTPTGLSTSEFWHWIVDHNSSTTKTVHKGHGDPDRHGNADKVKVPDVVGEKYRAGAEEIRDEHLIAQRGTPFVGTVRRESPHAGTRVRRGTVVTLSGRSGGGGRWPGPDPDRRKRRKHKKHHPAGK